MLKRAKKVATVKSHAIDYYETVGPSSVTKVPFVDFLVLSQRKYCR
jgi:hypothetical protein